MVSSLIKKAKESLEPKVVKGSHLTVTTHPDGRTELEWDDEALLRDVRAAILKAESIMPVSTTVEPAKKKAAPKKATAIVEAKPKAKTVAKKVAEPKTKRKTKETK
jgi:YD repeat-containing protein